jgi:hypothetical protein
MADHRQEWEADQLVPAYTACERFGLTKAAAEIARALLERGVDVSLPGPPLPDEAAA